MPAPHALMEPDRLPLACLPVATAQDQDRQAQQRDLAIWLLLSAVGLGLTLLAVRGGAPLGTRSAPFLGSYRFNIGVASLLAPVWAATILVAGARGLFDRLRWRQI